MLDTLQASILDLPNLITDKPTAHHIAAQLSQRVGWYWLALGRAQILEALGGLVMGKTVTTEFAYRQPGKTRNPWNAAFSPGGSSSGSAAAVAAGYRWAYPDGIVLLSPAAPSFGAFKDYRDRAEAFAREVRSLT